MKRLYRLEQSIGKYSERLLQNRPQTSSAESQVANRWIVQEIRTMLDNKMAAHSSKPELTQHFTQLFCGLDKISAAQSTGLEDPLDPRNNEQQILDAFDSHYFRGQATFKFTTRLLADKRVKDVEHFRRAVAQGGMILRTWTSSNREMFQLHIANKLWVIGRRKESSSKLLDDYNSFWKERLLLSDIPASDLRLLVGALVNTKAIPYDKLAGDLAQNWRSLFVIWQMAFPYQVECRDINNKDSLWTPLNHISQTSTHVPFSLRFVPLNSSIAPQQIRRALRRYAESSKNHELLDRVMSLERERESENLDAKLALA